MATSSSNGTIPSITEQSRVGYMGQRYGERAAPAPSPAPVHSLPLPEVRAWVPLKEAAPEFVSPTHPPSDGKTMETLALMAVLGLGFIWLSEGTSQPHPPQVSAQAAKAGRQKPAAPPIVVLERTLSLDTLVGDAVPARTIVDRVALDRNELAPGEDPQLRVSWHQGGAVIAPLNASVILAIGQGSLLVPLDPLVLRGPEPFVIQLPKGLPAGPYRLTIAWQGIDRTDSLEFSIAAPQDARNETAALLQLLWTPTGEPEESRP